MTRSLSADDARRLARAVLLPATDGSSLTPELHGFLQRGGRSILLGESRPEYLARRMSDARRATETTAAFGTLVSDIADAGPAATLIAIDQELGGIQRGHDLVAALPSIPDALSMEDAELDAACRRTARGLRARGIGMTLGPILDLIDGPQPWLDGRHLGDDPQITARIGAIYVRAFEAEGVATCAKHFPGHRGLTTDPATDVTAVVPGDLDRATRDLLPFREAVVAGTTAVMVGPGAVPGLGAPGPALLSAPVITLLRDSLAFRGLVVSDDLDARCVLEGRTVTGAAIEALVAGNDLLLVSADNDLRALSQAIAAAVDDGTVPLGRLVEAAAKVAGVADTFGVRGH